MDNTHDTASARPAPEHFSYTITPRAERVGGWRLQLFEGGLEVGGGTYPVTEDVARDDAHAEAVEDGEAWLASRGAAPAFSQSPAPIPEQVAQRSGIEGLNIGRIIELWDANTDRDFGILIEPFARAIEREVLATQSAKQGAQPSMSQRQSFEHWFSDEGKHPRAVERSGDGYVLLSAQSAWEAWKAAYKALDVTGRPSGAPTAGIQASVEQATGAKEGQKHLPGWERGIATVTMTGHQLREALDFINPDGDDDPEQRDNDLTFGIVQHKDDNGKVATGLCCWNDDTDGVLPLD